jgi:hypothetical protein
MEQYVCKIRIIILHSIRRLKKQKQYEKTFITFCTSFQFHLCTDARYSNVWLNNSKAYTGTIGNKNQIKLKINISEQNKKMIRNILFQDTLWLIKPMLKEGNSSLPNIRMLKKRNRFRRIRTGGRK